MAKKFRQQGNRFSDEMLTSVDITPSDDLTELFSESSDPRFIRGSLSRWQPDELIASELEYDEDFFGDLPYSAGTENEEYRKMQAAELDEDEDDPGEYLPLRRQLSREETVSLVGSAVSGRKEILKIEDLCSDNDENMDFLCLGFTPREIFEDHLYPDSIESIYDEDLFFKLKSRSSDI